MKIAEPLKIMLYKPDAVLKLEVFRRRFGYRRRGQRNLRELYLEK